ncbi:MAG: type III-A CRISPR-associated RAMP protein Csm4 [Bifidobacteriaceae bacterium]|jgi:CRISPR-associated protein Csm4|nr:type III-A CRISPR-associated RAMP protein Csm4 [Bifidobacteriaceae bacterium]
MNSKLFRLSFGRAHFGYGALSASGIGLRADTLCSALALEALKGGGEPRLDSFIYSIAQGTLRFTDAFPYVSDQYLLPKPLVRIVSTESDSSAKKLAKQISYLPADSLDSFVAAKLGKDDLARLATLQGQLGRHETHTKVATSRTQDDPEPYRVGVFSFAPNAGLWLDASGTDGELDELSQVLAALALGGIGGRRTSGLGRFELAVRDLPAGLAGRMGGEPGARNALLSCAYPTDQELDAVLQGATYGLVKRSGFVASATYADSPLRKRDLHKFAAGSVFTSPFDGVLADVGMGGAHPVYSYAKAFWLRLEGDAHE